MALEIHDQSIACEISVTTTVEHEVGNIKKCLNAGLAQVIVMTSYNRVLGKIREVALDALGEERLSSVQFFLFEDLFMYLDHIAAESKTKEEVVKGYKVKVRYKSLTPDEQQARKEATGKTVLQAMKRLGRK